MSPAAEPPMIAGRPPQVIKAQVRQGLGEMPAFSAALIPDGSLGDLARYVAETLVHPAIGQEELNLGPRAWGPVPIGICVAVALAVFCLGVSLLFGPARN
jgi:hypothetical protein